MPLSRHTTEYNIFLRCPSAFCWCWWVSLLRGSLGVIDSVDLPASQRALYPLGIRSCCPTTGLFWPLQGQKWEEVQGEQCSHFPPLFSLNWRSNLLRWLTGSLWTFQLAWTALFFPALGSALDLTSVAASLNAAAAKHFGGSAKQLFLWLCLTLWMYNRHQTVAHGSQGYRNYQSLDPTGG